MFLTPPHAPHDRDKTAAMVKALRKGETLPPILVLENDGQAFCGSHRIAAWEIMDIEPNYVMIDQDEYNAIMRHIKLDPITDIIYEFDEFMAGAWELGFAHGAIAG